MITPETPSFELECDPFGTLSIEFAGAANDWTEDEVELSRKIREGWQSYWPTIRDELAGTIARYKYGKNLAQLIGETPHCLGISLSPENNALGEDWSLDLVVSSTSERHSFYVGIKDREIVSSGACF